MSLCARASTRLGPSVQNHQTALRNSRQRWLQPASTHSPHSQEAQRTALRETHSERPGVCSEALHRGVAVPIGQASARVSSRFGPRASPLSARRHAAISMPLHVPLSCSPWPCPTSASSRAHDQLMCSLTYLLTHLLTYSLTHLLTYSRAHEQLMCYKHCRPCYTVLAVLMSSSHVLQTLPPLLHCTRSGFDAPRGDREGAGARRA